MRIKMLSKLIILMFLILLSIVNCELQITAMGYPNRIFVFADSSLWGEVENEFRFTFEDEIITPHAENSFYITWKPLKELVDFKDRMNVFFLGVENEKNETNQYILKSLPDEFLAGLKKNEMFYFFAPHMFANHQIGMFAFAEDRDTFRKNLTRIKDEMYDRFKKKYFERLKKEMYTKGEQKDLEKTLAENYGWKVRVQHDYFIANQTPEEKYVWLRRIQPNRWLSVWKISQDSSITNREILIGIRNKMAGKYYEGDVVEEPDTHMIFTKLGERKATKLVGLWRNDSLLVGGPFRLYSVYDSLEQANYLIDIAVMATRQNKKPFLDQLEVIASTFDIERVKTEK